MTPTELAAELRRSLLRSDSGETRRKIRVLMAKCGWKKRTPERMQLLAAALEAERVFADTDISDVSLSPDRSVRLSLRSFRRLDAVFDAEWELQRYLGKDLSGLDAALPELGPFKLVDGYPRQVIYHWEGQKHRPDLVLRCSDGLYLAVELEVDDPPENAAIQVEKYVESVAKKHGPARGLLISAKPRTSGLETLIRNQLIDLNTRGIEAHWLWYKVSVDLRPVVSESTLLAASEQPNPIV